MQGWVTSWEVGHQGGEGPWSSASSGLGLTEMNESQGRGLLECEQLQGKGCRCSCLDSLRMGELLGGKMRVLVLVDH